MKTTDRNGKNRNKTTERREKLDFAIGNNLRFNNRSR